MSDFQIDLYESQIALHGIFLQVPAFQLELAVWGLSPRSKYYQEFYLNPSASVSIEVFHHRWLNSAVSLSYHKAGPML